MIASGVWNGFLVRILYDPPKRYYIGGSSKEIVYDRSLFDCPMRGIKSM